MTEKTTAPASELTPESKAQASAPAAKRSFVSAGERIHQWTTYLSVDWVFNAIAGVSFAYVGKHTELGKKFWSGPITGFFEGVLPRFISNPQAVARSADKGLMFISIIAGGMFTIPPLIVLESAKVKKGFVKFYDTLVYGKEKVAHDPKFQRAYDEIDHEPKKDGLSGMIARAFALAPLLAIVLIPFTQGKSEKYFFGPITKAAKQVAKTVGIQPKGLMEMRPEDIAGAAAASARVGKEIKPQTRWDYIHESFAMDFGLGLPYAGLHAVFYGLFAKLLHKEKQPQIASVSAAPSPASARSATPDQAVEASGKPSTSIHTTTHHQPLADAKPRELFV